MSEYTPTTEQLREDYMWAERPRPSADSAAEFDRWLDQVRAVARREGQAEAWAEAHADGCEYVIDSKCRQFHPNPYEAEEDRHVDQ